MAFMKTNSVKITCAGVTKDSLADYGLAIANTDYLGTPETGQNLVQVPGRSGVLDLTDAVFGGVYFTHREIKIEFGGIQAPEDWDMVISDFRSSYEGKFVTLEFATMPGWKISGRAKIDKFQHKRALGTFIFRIPYAGPYFEKPYTETLHVPTGMLQAMDLEIHGSGVIPTVTVTQDCTVYWQYTGQTQVIESYYLIAGTTTMTDIYMTPEKAKLLFSGGGDISVQYTDRRL